MKKKEFSSDEIEKMKILYNKEKLSKEDIGKRFHCSEIVIKRIFQENNIANHKGGPVSVVTTEEIIRCYVGGMGCGQIGKKFGVTASAISQRIPKNIIRKRGPIPKLSDLELFRLHHEEKKSIAYISRKFNGVPFSTSLRDRVIALGIYSQDDVWVKERKNPIKIHDGYARVKIPKHPRADKNGYVLQHTVVVEQKLGRYLVYDKQKQDGEVVHHIDGNTIRNAPSNLVPCKNNLEHREIHNQLDSILSKLVKLGIIVFDIVQRKYYLNYNNPVPTRERKINPEATLHTSGTRRYLKIKKPGHHREDARGRVLEHIIIAEKKEGREISENEPIHHIDLDKRNNWPENLLVCKNTNEHDQFLPKQLNSLVRDLIDNKKLFFNKETKEYYTEKK